jgi:hypothetical protein
MDLAGHRAAAQGLIYARLCLMGDPSQNAALPPKDSGPQAFGGPHHLTGFLLLPSEGYTISTARTSSMADLPLLRKFPLCIRDFYVRCSRTHPPSWERTSSVCIIHLYSVLFARPPHLFSYCISFLRISHFSSFVHPYVLSIWRAIS